MRIKSNFVDYYDFVANQFGGGDPRVVYNRVPFPQDKTEWSPKTFELNDSKIAKSLHDISLFNIRSVWEYNSYINRKWIIVCGKGYLIVSNNQYDYSTPTTFHLFNADDCKSFGFRTSFENIQSNYIGFETPILLELHRKLNVPIFYICDYSPHRGTINIGYNIPILKTYGFASLISPQEMYQDISYFLANTIHGSPDIDTPVQLDNEELIIKAGFDLKTSFRHPIK